MIEQFFDIRNDLLKEDLPLHEKMILTAAEVSVKADLTQSHPILHVHVCLGEGYEYSAGFRPGGLTPDSVRNMAEDTALLFKEQCDGTE